MGQILDRVRPGTGKKANGALNLAFPMENFRSPGALAALLVSLCAGLGIDLWTKQIAFSQLVISVTMHPDGGIGLAARPPVRFIEGFVHFEATVNQGAVFGIGQGRRTLFVAVSLAAVVFLLWLFAHSGRQRFYQVILGMLLAGVLGNLYDRLALGYVRDMIHMLFFGRDVFPWIFNVADVLLCTGVFLMLLHSVFSRPAHASAATATGGATPDG